jgi:hypothetical protein
MRANNVPFNAVGNSGIFELLAERLSSPSPAPDARSDGVPAAPSNNAIARLMAATEARDTVLVRRPLYTRYAPGLSGPEGRAIARSGLWSRVAFVGASLLVAGLVLLGDGAANALPALGLILGGGALATFGWRSAWKALDRIDPPAAGTAAFIDSVKGRPVYLALSGKTMELDGEAKCVRSC